MDDKWLKEIERRIGLRYKVGIIHGKPLSGYAIWAESKASKKVYKKVYRRQIDQNIVEDFVTYIENQ